MANKKERIKSLIRKNISDIILFELKDPLMKSVTVTYVDVSDDFSYAKVYVTCFDENKKDKVVDELTRLKGVIRSYLAKTLDIHRIPSLSFYYDDTFKKGERIDELLKSLQKKED